jgi:hypothetical protein
MRLKLRIRIKESVSGNSRYFILCYESDVSRCTVHGCVSEGDAFDVIKFLFSHLAAAVHAEDLGWFDTIGPKKKKTNVGGGVYIRVYIIIIIIIIIITVRAYKKFNIIPGLEVNWIYSLAYN